MLAPRTSYLESIGLIELQAAARKRVQNNPQIVESASIRPIFHATGTPSRVDRSREIEGDQWNRDQLLKNAAHFQLLKNEKKIPNSTITAKIILCHGTLEKNRE